MFTKQKHTRVVSSTPGRTRLRVSHKRRTKKEMERLVAGLRDRLDGADAHPNLQTGSIILHHPHNSLEDVSSVLHDLGVILATVVDIDIPSPGGKTKVATDIAGAIYDLNHRVGLATNGVVNLRVLVPLGLGTLAILQLLRRGLQIEAAPWYVLAYAAFDTFVMLHPPDRSGHKQ